MREKRAIYINGYAGIVGLVVLALVGLFFFYLGMWQAKVWALFLSIFLWLIALLLLSSATVVSPNQAKVILFFGQYLGTIRENGFFLTIPLAQKMTVSLKVRNFNSSVLKVNDLDGNPIEISAVVVFKVIDTAKALFDVAYYQDFVEIQSETAIRHIASQYPYDTFNDDDLTLRGNTTADSGQETVNYRYILPGYTKEGKEKELDFNGQLTRPLRKGAYLKITWNKKKGVTSYEEVEKKDVPKTALEKLIKG